MFLITFQTIVHVLGNIWITDNNLKQVPTTNLTKIIDTKNKAWKKWNEILNIWNGKKNGIFKIWNGTKRN